MCVSIYLSNVENLHFSSLKNTVTETSSSQTQQLIKLVNRSNLPQFLNESVTPNVKPNQDTQIVQLKEEPMIFMQDKFKMKLKSSPEFLETFLTSFETFIRQNPQTEAMPSPRPQEQINTPNVAPSPQPPPQLPVGDTKLQKDYNPMTVFDSEVQASSFNHNMKCYINACISSNLTERAFATLKFTARNNKFLKFERATAVTEMYCDIMAKYSSMGNWTRVNEIYDILIAGKKPITPQIYMNVLDCLGRMKNNTNNVKLIQKFADKANEQVSYIIQLNFGPK